jgi:hypothetical protein
MRFYPVGPRYSGRFITTDTGAPGRFPRAPVRCVFGLPATGYACYLFFISSLTGGVPGFRVLSRGSEPGPAALYLLTYDVTVLILIPEYSAILAGDFPFARRKTTCSRTAYLYSICPPASNCPVKILSSAASAAFIFFTVTKA